MTDKQHTLKAAHDRPVNMALLVKWSDYVVKRAASEAVAESERRVQNEQAYRQVIEDTRANHRNLNRLLTLLCAFVIGLALTWLLQNPQLLVSLGVSPALVKSAAPYTFVITIFMDSSLAAYSFFRKY